jgi:hypothetical protein
VTPSPLTNAGLTCFTYDFYDSAGNPITENTPGPVFLTYVPASQILSFGSTTPNLLAAAPSSIANVKVGAKKIIDGSDPVY